MSKTKNTSKNKCKSIDTCTKNKLFIYLFICVTHQGRQQGSSMCSREVEERELTEVEGYIRGRLVWIGGREAEFYFDLSLPFRRRRLAEALWDR